MNSKICVFLGPSLAAEQARSILPSATYFPPAKMGDIYNAVRSNYSTIALIDGFFDACPAPWHKEILYALSRGVSVYGASSMGALRAAETDEFGMIGVGKIYNWYKENHLTDDDEVAVIHQPSTQGFTPLSEALVNIRHTLQECVRQSRISLDFSKNILMMAKQTFYADRSWRTLLKSVPKKYHAERLSLEAYIREGKPNLKEDDAKELLELLKGEQTSEMGKINFVFEPTTFWKKLTRAMHHDDHTGTRMEHIYKLAKFSPWNNQVLRDVLFNELVKSESNRLGIILTAETLETSVKRWRYSNGLLSIEKLTEWMDQRAMNFQQLSSMVECETLERELYKFFPSSSDNGYELTLKRLGVWRVLSEVADRSFEIYVRNGSLYPTLDEINMGLEELLFWYEQHIRSIGQDLELHVKSCGFQSSAVFISELTLLYSVWTEFPKIVEPMLTRTPFISSHET
jgi:hypothetical protein